MSTCGPATTALDWGGTTALDWGRTSASLNCRTSEHMDRRVVAQFPATQHARVRAHATKAQDFTQGSLTRNPRGRKYPFGPRWPQVSVY